MKILFIMLAMLAIPFAIKCEEPDCPETPMTIEPTLEFKAGYFFFSNSTLRKVYDQGGLDVQLSGTAPLWKWLQLYLSVEYLQRSGRSLHFHQKTSLWQLPVSLGLRGSVKITPRVLYYGTLGPRYFFLHAENKSQFVDKTICHNGIGGFVNTGFLFRPFRQEHSFHNFLIDVYGEYAYEKVHFHASKQYAYGKNIQVGGFSFGGGIGYAF